MKILDIPQCGKLGLTVTYQGRNGLIRRAYAVPANPNTPAQLAVRSALTAEAARTAWLRTSLAIAIRSRAARLATFPG